ncbi:MAG: hypothetical protein JRI66_12270 [Deltaproteobacteria bacterium]|nr:hypothetical protein [Deltaproteobacteria bacterium]
MSRGKKSEVNITITYKLIVPGPPYSLEAYNALFDYLGNLCYDQLRDDTFMPGTKVIETQTKIEKITMEPVVGNETK